MDAQVGPRAPREPGLEPRFVLVGLGAILFIVAFGFIVAIVRPFPAGTIAYDGAASVLFFDRIASGTRLETFVNTTPKPLLTLVFGSLHAATGGWLAVSLASAAVAAIAAVLGAALATRMAGFVAGGAAFVIVVAGAQLLVEVSWSHALPWALAAWLLAALALTSTRPHFVVAGVALFVGALARQETYLLIAASSVIGLTLVAMRRVPPSAAWLLVSWLALPVSAAHDVALTGDPLFSFRVATISAASIETRTPAEVAGMIGQAVLDHAVMAVAAIVGIVGVSRRPRGWVVALGLTIIILGISAMVLALSFTHRQTLVYYLDPVIVGIGYAAALGVGLAARAIDTRLGSGMAPADPRRVAIGIVAGVILGVIALRQGLPTQQTIDDLGVQRQIAASAAAAEKVIRPLTRDLATSAPVGDPEVRPDPAWTRVLVPRPVQTRMAVDLGLPMTVVGPLVPNAPTPGVIHEGLVVYHDEQADPERGLARKFEGSTATTIDGVRFVPVGRPTHRSWVWRSAP